MDEDRPAKRGKLLFGILAVILGIVILAWLAREAWEHLTSINRSYQRADDLVGLLSALRWPLSPGRA